MINWDRLAKRELQPPFKPKIVSVSVFFYFIETRMSIKGNALDVSNFDKDFLREKVDLTPVDEAVAKSIVQSVSIHIYD